MVFLLYSLLHLVRRFCQSFSGNFLLLTTILFFFLVKAKNSLVIRFLYILDILLEVFVCLVQNKLFRYYIYFFKLPYGPVKVEYKNNFTVWLAYQMSQEKNTTIVKQVFESTLTACLTKRRRQVVGFVSVLMGTFASLNKPPRKTKIFKVSCMNMQERNNTKRHELLGRTF